MSNRIIHVRWTQNLCIHLQRLYIIKMTTEIASFDALRFRSTLTGQSLKNPPHLQPWFCPSLLIIILHEELSSPSNNLKETKNNELRLEQLIQFTVNQITRNELRYASRAAELMGHQNTFLPSTPDVPTWKLLTLEIPQAAYLQYAIP